MKKVLSFVVAFLFVAINTSCSSDDKNEPIVEPPVVIPVKEYETAIQKEWVFTKYQLLDKDRKVVHEVDGKGQDCKNNVWIFKEELDGDNEKVKIRTDLSYVSNPDTNTCEEHKKKIPYSINNGNELVTALINDGDQIMLYFFEIREMQKNKMFLIRKDYLLTEEEAIKYNYPKEARYLQYELVKVK